MPKEWRMSTPMGELASRLGRRGCCKLGNNCIHRQAKDFLTEVSTLRAEVARLSEQLHQTDIDCQTAHAEWEAADQECERLRARVDDLEAAIRWTHDTYCDESWTGRGLHAPECLLYELEDDDE